MPAQAYILLTVTFTKEEGKWIATCSETGTSTFADTFEEVSEEIKEMLSLHLNTLEELGARKNFFKENNIRVHHKPLKSSHVRRELPVNPNVITQSFSQMLTPADV